MNKNDDTTQHRRKKPGNISRIHGLLLWLGVLLHLFRLSVQAGQGAGEQSQVAEHHHPWWVTVGGGPSLIGGVFSMSAGMVYSYQFENSIISGRILGATNINPTVQTIEPAETKYRVADYGVLYGPIWHYGRSYVALGAGVGLVRAAQQSAILASTNTSISLPVEAQWFWQPTNFAGFGVYAYAGLNFKKNLYGLLLCAQLGVW